MEDELSRRRWIFLAVVLAAGAGGGLWLRSRAADGAPKYRTAPVESGVIESLVSATGTVRPVVQVEVGSQVSGTVASLHADYNSRVRAGQVLCQLEPSSFRARVAQSEATVARAEAALKEGRRQLARARELIAENYVSRAEVEQAEVAVEQREAELKQARAQLQAARVDLAHTTIHAPIDGVVIARSVDLGQTVAASLQAPRLFVIANDLTRMQVETRIDEADIGVIRAGMPVRFTVDAFPDDAFEGRIAQVRLEPIVEQGVVTYTTVIHTDNPELKLRPGMTANVSVLVARRDEVLKVPNSALRFRPEEGKGGGGVARAANLAGGPGREAGAPAAARRLPDPSREAGAGRERGRRRDGGAGGGRPGSPAGTSGAAPEAEAPRPATRLGDGARETGPPEREGTGETPLRPGSVFALRDGKPVRVPVRTGLTDGTFTEIQSDGLAAGDRIIVGLDLATRGANLQPPPGMGGPGFGRGSGRGSPGGSQGRR